MSEYWILKWVTNEGLDNLDEAQRRLAEPGGLERLVSFAAEQASKDVEVIPEAANQLVAGVGMDLSGLHECGQARCLKRKVDEVLYRAWHYFDKVVVSGLDSRRFMTILKQAGSDKSKLYHDLMVHIDVAFYIRETGAEKALIFCDKDTHTCPDCFYENMEGARFSETLKEASENLAEALYRGSRVQIAKRLKIQGQRMYWYSHPALDAGSLKLYDKEPFPEASEFARDMAREQAITYTAHAILSAALAEHQSASLGQLTACSLPQLAEIAAKPTPEEVAFNLQLPILQALPIKEILTFREHEAAEFHAFRAALRTAIGERLKALPDSNAEQIAESVYEDVLEPALISLDRKASKAVDLLARRSVATLAVGSVVTTIGLLAFAPIVTPGIVIAAGGALANYLEWLKDRKEVELSDLYFLWHLTDKAAARHVKS